MDDNTKNLIQNHIDNNDVCLFMKGTPDAPQCGFSMAVSNMLKILEVNFKGVNVLENQSLREGIKVFSDWWITLKMHTGKLFQTNEFECQIKSFHAKFQKINSYGSDPTHGKAYRGVVITPRTFKGALFSSAWFSSLLDC